MGGGVHSNVRGFPSVILLMVRLLAWMYANGFDNRSVIYKKIYALHYK